MTEERIADLERLAKASLGAPYCQPLVKGALELVSTVREQEREIAALSEALDSVRNAAGMVGF